MPEKLFDVPFYRASTVPREFEIVSKVMPIRMHWDQTANQGRLCGRSLCALCREGMKSEIRWLIRLAESEDSHYLMEFRTRHREFCESASEIQSRGLAVVVAVFRDGTLRNSPVEGRILREGVLKPLFDLRRLVDACYLAPLLVKEGPRVEPGESLPELGQVQDTRFRDQFPGMSPEKLARVRARMTNWPSRK
jgi:hypothetical protein